MIFGSYKAAGGQRNRETSTASERAIAIMLSFFLLVSSTYAAEEVSPFLKAYRAYDKAYTDSDLPSALEHAREALVLGREEIGAKHEKTAILAINLGHVLTLLGEYEQAEAPLAEAREILQAQGGAEHPALLTAYKDFILIHSASGRLNQAREAFDFAQRILNKDAKAVHEAVALMVDRAGFEARVGQWDAALAQLDKTATFAENKFGATDLRVGDIWYQRASLNIQRGASEEGLRDVKKALAIWEKNKEADAPRLMRAHGTIASMYDKLGDQKAFKTHSDKMLALIDEGADQAMPLLLTNPRLPEAAEGRAAITGSALVSLDVGTDGRAAGVAIVESNLPGDYVQAIVQAANRWLFRPRFVDGKRALTKGLRARVVVEAGDISIHIGTLGAS